MRVTAATCTAAGVGNGDFAAVLRHVNAVAGFKCQRFITHNFLIGSTGCAGLRALAAKLGLSSPRGMMRVNDELFGELKLDTVNDDQLYAALAAHPKLLERPILELADRAAIGRPLENIQALLGS